MKLYITKKSIPNISFSGCRSALVMAAIQAAFLVLFYSGYGQTYGYTGAVQSYTFSSNACIKLKAWGAGGGIGGGDVAGNGGSGGGGAYAELMLNVHNGDVMQIYTGGGGSYGVGGSGTGSGAAGWGYGAGGRGGNAGAQGGSGAGGGGGGSSTVVLNGTVVLVAAGGGGGGGSGCANLGMNAGGGGQPGQATGQDGPFNPCNAPTGAQGYDRGGGDGGGGGGGGGGWNGGEGGGVTSQGGTDCNYGGGAASGGGGASLGTNFMNGAGQTPGNSADPDLCASCAIGSTVPNTPGGNGIVILIISNITLTTTIGNNGPLCPGATLNLSSSAAASTFSWTGPLGFTSALPNPSIPATGTANSGIYTLIVTDTLGCADTVTTNALINPNPVASISPPVDTLTCAVTSITLTANSNAVTPNYLWTGGATTSTDNVTQPATWAVTVTDASTGCTTTASVPVGQNITAPTVSINQPAPLTCATTIEPLTAVSDSPTALYHWSDGSNSNPDNVSSPGSYNVTATAPGNGCTAAATVTVTQIPSFTDTFSVSPVTCFGQANGGIQTTETGGTPPFKFVWSNADTTQNISNIATGNYSVTITDQYQCLRVISGAQVPQPPQIAITFADVNETCFASTDATITPTVTGGLPGYTYAWADGPTTQNRNNLAIGTYTLTATDNAGCTMSASTVITRPSQLLVSADMSNPYCPTLPPNGSITITPTNGTAPYHFTWTNGQTAPTLTNLDTGSYAVTISDANNCSSDTSFLLTYTFDFSVQAFPSATIHLGGSASIGYYLNGNTGPYTALWDPAFSLACPDCMNTTGRPVRTTLYQVYITDSVGCTASDSLTVFVIPDYRVFVPNAFSPNGDGNNDFFEVSGNKETWQYFSIRIFDRWGEKVFESTDMNFKWDGNFKDHRLQPAVYVYEVRVVYIDDHTDQLYKGDVTLVR